MRTIEGLAPAMSASEKVNASTDPAALVVVVGIGGVGSHCAHLLVRAGVSRLRLIDFDRVSLSSLNRNAFCTRRDVGISKVEAAASHLRRIAPDCHLDTRDSLFEVAAASQLLGPCVLSGCMPALVVDCIDDVDTKADLLQYCVEQGLKVISCQGAGAKADPTAVCIGSLTDVFHDPLAVKLRSTLRKRAVRWDGETGLSSIQCVYSAELAERKLLPLTEEQRAAPAEFGALANFRLRVIPVLGCVPALMGMITAHCALVELSLLPRCWAKPVPSLTRDALHKMLEKLQKTDKTTDLTMEEANFVTQVVWKQRDSFDDSLRCGAERGKKWSLVRWDASKPATVHNLLLLSDPAASEHLADTGATGSLPALLLQQGAEVPQKYATVGERLNSVAQRQRQHAQIAFKTPQAAAAPLAWKVRCDLAEEPALLAEQLSRNASFFGDDGQAKLAGAFVVVVGCGVAGSHAIHMIARAGCSTIRLVDPAVVTSSALRAHATAAADQLGLSRTVALKQSIQQTVPHAQIECVTTPFEAAVALAPNSSTDQIPSIVIECSDNLDSKIEVLSACVEAKLHAVTCLGVDRCLDPTALCISPLQTLFEDPAGCVLRASVRGLAEARIDVVHSSEPSWASEQSGSPVVAACVGMAAAGWALCNLAKQPFETDRRLPSMSVWKKLLSRLKQREKASGFETAPGAAFTAVDLFTAGCLAEVVWGSRCAITNVPHGNAKLVLTRWDRSKPSAASNLVLMCEDEANKHDAATAITGGLPPQLAAGEAHWQQLQRKLALLEQHVVNCGSEPSSRATAAAVSNNSSEAAAAESPDLETKSKRARNSSAQEAVDHPTDASAGGVSGLIGNTKMVQLRALSEALGCVVLGKAEFLNPGGCQKDRVALRIVQEAEASGALKPGGTIVEGTSGSTGISLSLVGRSRGYKVLIVMPDDQAKEKIATLERLGAQVLLVKPSSIVSAEHYVNVARQRATEIEGGYFCNQFENLANFRAHYLGTGPEIWQQANGRIDAFVMAAGTGGTVAGVGRSLKERDDQIQIWLGDPAGSSLFHKVQSGVLYAPEQAERQLQRHRYDTVTEGIGLERLTANFSQGLAEHNEDGMDVISGAVKVSDQEAVEMARYLLDHEGLFVGSSAALNCAALVKVARQADWIGTGKVLVTILCDGGQRHMSKFHNPEFLEGFGLKPASGGAREDLSFVK